MAKETAYINEIGGTGEKVAPKETSLLVEESKKKMQINEMNEEQRWLAEQFGEKKGKTMMIKEVVEDKYKKIVNETVSRFQCPKLRFSHGCAVYTRKLRRFSLKVIKSNFFIHLM